MLLEAERKRIKDNSSEYSGVHESTLDLRQAREKKKPTEKIHG